MNNNDQHVDDAELERLGIRRVETHVFHWGEYVYSSMRDAVAAAKRAEKR